ncbi:MAG TPA: ATP-binding protein [Caulobacteraceae bacterium]|jgi:signal transduction histidine kinase|nr:ATP-binding protein [Caulobacteraceae bacterium]
MTPPRAPTTSLFLQALGLVFATLIAVLVATTIVIINMPPPAPEIYTVAEVAEVLRTAKTADTVEGRALDVSLADAPPETGDGGPGRRHASFRLALAQALHIPPENVIVGPGPPHLMVFGGGPPRAARRPPPQQTAPDTSLFGAFVAAVRQPNGKWLTVEPRGQLLDAWQLRFLLVLGFALLAVTPLAWWFARRIAAPISAFARAAERLGRDPDAPPLDVRGSSEVKSAASAFNLMQERLKRYVSYRTTMIGAIAHDLRTPLTRLRFRIESVPEELRPKLAADLDEMEAMVASTLAFVQDATSPVERTKLEVSSLVETVMDEAAETGANASVDRAERAVIDGDPVALKRLVTNLVGNALKFGSCAKGRVYAEAGMAIFEVDDNGPGIPESEIERAFEPFQRLETSRSRETGGAGLGLAVVRAIARGHGGDVSLHNRAGGGLTARVTLPLAVPASSGLVRRLAAE